MTKLDLSLLTEGEQKDWKLIIQMFPINPMVVDGLYQSLIAARAENKRHRELVETHRQSLEAAALEAGEKAGEAFSRSKYSAADYWLCMEFRFQRAHDDFCKLHSLTTKCCWSKYREFISQKRLDWRALLQSEKGGE